MNRLHLPRFAPSLMSPVRSVGYFLRSAQFDLIDNSISAGARIAEIGSPSNDEHCIAIKDVGIRTPGRFVDSY